MRLQSLVAWGTVCLRLSGWPAAGHAADPPEAQDSAFDGPGACLELYFRSFSRGDLAAADSMWAAQDRAHAHRLGIQLMGAPLKQDSASPLPGLLTAHAIDVAPSVQELSRSADLASLRVGLWQRADALQAIYQVERLPHGWRLASPLRLATRGWAERQTQSLCFLAPDTTWFVPIAMEFLEQQVDRVAGALQIDSAARWRLRQQKLDWIYAPAQTVTELAGAPTQGVANLQFDAVITQERTHVHELVHLLVNLWLGDAPLFVLPLLQEGVAVDLGGRWQKAPEVEAMLGAALLQQNSVEIDELLTQADFNALSADIAYPVAGLFCGYLLETMGPGGFATLYRALGGTQAQVAALDDDGVRQRMAEISGESWESLRRGFRQWWPAHTDQHLRAAPTQPPGKVTEIAGKGCAARMVVEHGSLWLEISPQPGNTRGALLFSGKAAALPPSRLFAERLPQLAYHGERLGVLFDAQEAGVYDFGLDLILGKFAPALGSKGAMWDDTRHCVRLRVDRTLLPRGLDPSRVAAVAIP